MSSDSKSPRPEGQLDAPIPGAALQLSEEVFDRLYPFGILVDGDGRVARFGSALRRLVEATSELRSWSS